MVISLLFGMIPWTSTAATPVLPEAMATKNETMMQYFEWNLPNDGQFWTQMGQNAAALSQVGITSLWIPPFTKGVKQEDVGYGAYDLWDLGEFNQKGTIRTKYGTKDELKSAITALHTSNIKVYGDIVLNHKGGSEGTESSQVIEVDPANRLREISGTFAYNTPTVFTYPGRAGKYSAFKWSSKNFTGVDEEKPKKIFKIAGAGKGWNNEVDTENGNYDFLLYSDVDLQNQEVIDEYNKWGEWVVNELDLDGFRIDAAKHMRFDFVKDWLTTMRSKTGKPLFAVAEYLSGNTSLLEHYLEKTAYTTDVFDVKLHYSFKEAGDSNGGYDLRHLLDGSTVVKQPKYTVTYVDSHDSQPGQLLESFIASWFKPLAYATILTRDQGTPCLFYGDYYGIAKNGIAPMKSKLDPLIKARADYAYGKQNDYMDDGDVVGWTREGDSAHPGSGLATVMSDNGGNTKRMLVGTAHAGEVWEDLTGNQSEKVTIGTDGFGTFRVGEKSVSVYVNKNGKTSPTTTTTTTKEATPIPTTITTTPKTDIVVTPETTADQFVIYYKNGFAAPNIYYHVDAGKWSTGNGTKMEPSEFPGFSKVVIEANGGTTLEFVLNDDGKTWENNDKKNFKVTKGVWTFIDKTSLTQVYPGPTATPAPTEAPTATPAPTEVPTLSPTETPEVTATPTPVITPVVTATPKVVATATPKATPVTQSTATPVPTNTVDSGNSVTTASIAHVFYQSNANQMTMVVRKTTSTGMRFVKVKMTKSAFPGFYYAKTAPGQTGIDVTFTDGKRFIDTNKGAKYKVKSGINIISKNKVTWTDNEE